MIWLRALVLRLPFFSFFFPLRPKERKSGVEKRRASFLFIDALGGGGGGGSRRNRSRQQNGCVSAAGRE